MLWRLSLGLLVGSLLGAQAPSEPAPSKALWDEYGLTSAETRTAGNTQVTVYRFRDTTGAYAARLMFAGEGRELYTQGQYVVACDAKPCPATIDLGKVSRGPLPTLDNFLPTRNLVSRSERYILGPVSLAAFAPGIPASAAAFQFGTEGEVARYRTPNGEQDLAVFSYPTPQMARDQVGAFQKSSAFLVKRSGPLVAVVFGSHDPEAGKSLLSQVNYDVNITIDEQPPLVIRPQTAAQIVLGAIELAGVVIVFCAVSGLAFAGYKLLMRRFGDPRAQDAMIALRLSDE